MLIIRLRQQGKINRQSYRLVVTDCRAPRDGKYVEKLGWYDPMAKEENSLFIDEEKVLFWLDRGAQLSERAQSLIRRAAPGLLSKYFQDKLEKKLKRKK